jgi:hypothetical protein
MGYCISEEELPEEVREDRFERPPHPEYPDEMIPDIVGGEMRSESFVLNAETANEHDGRLELYYDQIPRLRALLDFIENRYNVKWADPSRRKT